MNFFYVVVLRPFFLLWHPYKRSRPLWGALWTMVFSLVLVLFVYEIADSMMTAIFTRYRENSLYHAQIESRYDLTLSQETLHELKKEENVLGVFREVRGLVLGSSPHGLSALELRGLDTSALLDPLFQDTLTFLEGEPRLLHPQEILISTSLAQRLNLHRGDHIRLLRPSRLEGGAKPRIGLFQVSGIFTTGYTELDSLWVLTALEDAENFLRGGLYQEWFGLKVLDLEQLENTLSVLEEKFPLLLFVSWKSRIAHLYQNFSSIRSFLLFLIFILVLMASYNVKVALQMFVEERQKDMALYKSLGLSSQTLMALFLLWGFFIGLSSGLLGLSLAFLTLSFWQDWFLVLEKSLGFLQSFLAPLWGGFSEESSSWTLLNADYYLRDFSVNLDFSVSLFIFLLHLFLCTASAYFPARLAAESDPRTLFGNGN